MVEESAVEDAVRGNLTSESVLDAIEMVDSNDNDVAKTGVSSSMFNIAGSTPLLLYLVFILI